MLILCLILPGNAINHKEYDQHLSFSQCCDTDIVIDLFIYFLLVFRIAI